MSTLAGPTHLPNFAPAVQNNNPREVIHLLSNYMMSNAAGVPDTFIRDVRLHPTPATFVLDVVENLDTNALPLPVQRKLMRGVSATVSRLLGKEMAQRQGGTERKKNSRPGKRDRAARAQGAGIQVQTPKPATGEKRQRDSNDKDACDGESPSKRQKSEPEETQPIKASSELAARFTTMLQNPSLTPFLIKLADAYSIDLDTPTILPVLDRLMSLGATSDCSALVSRYDLFSQTSTVRALRLQILRQEDIQSIHELIETEDQARDFLQSVNDECRNLLEKLESSMSEGVRSEDNQLLRSYAKHGARIGVSLDLDMTPYPHIVTGWRLGAITWLARETADQCASIGLAEDVSVGGETLLWKAVESNGGVGSDYVRKVAAMTLMEYGKPLEKVTSRIISKFQLNHWADGVRDKVIVKQPEAPADNGTSQAPLPIYETSAPVEFVGTEEELANLEAIFSHESKPRVVAMDCEWVPDAVTVGGARPPPAILQLAVDFGDSEKVFIIDLIGFEKERVQRTLLQIFNDKTVKKLGFSFKQDNQLLRKSFPSLPTQIPNFQEISTFPLEGGKQKKKALPSLHQYVAYYLKKRLDKTHRISDWEARPLSKEQMRYGAADVMCLLDIYRIVKK
ncbi:Exonuclease mut-7 [Rhizophlyctis rosea]|uniref:Exonuclease mut-7 n=1 Tax=Rhizophlyctis rosea TaxID=64517 RepID=A0AAD5X7U7_9FUNG|nr:Exonuclease mut-7 [Rhizophlyctis rosea]